MSELEKLVDEIGLEVGRLAQHMNQEKANISGELEGLSYLPELQQKMSSLVRETENKKNEKNELEQEIRRLERDYFREVDHCRQIGDAKDRLLRESQCLERALEDIKKSNEKMREERSSFIAECKGKLKTYDEYISANEKLKAFVEVWLSKDPSNFQLISLPEMIRETARKLSGYYETPLEATLESALQQVHADVRFSGAVDSDNSATATDSPLPAQDAGAVSGVEDNMETEAATSDVLLDSQYVEASRLRMSALDVSMLSSVSKSDAVTGNKTEGEDTMNQGDTGIC